jgi:tetratricopeptide (TPR) repeat protein
VKKNVFAATFLFACTTVAQQPGEPKPPAIMAGFSNLHHPVSTHNQEAQQFFDQGLRLVYAFNHEEATRAFRRAAELDSQLAMAWWGIALAAGPNYNLGADREHEAMAVEAVNKAKALSAGASAVENAYIEAIAHRFSSDPGSDLHQLDLDYSKSMDVLAHTYPDDLDAATLYADSLMNLRPWKLWNADGTPADGTSTILSTLESVLRRDPNHIGAMHLYMHAVEASPNPERALPYAERIAALAPAAGHLVHMPSHIYERTGNFDGARVQNAAAAKADEAFASSTGVHGLYMMMYYSHNLHFGAVAAAMQGRCADAQASARQLAANLAPMATEMPMVEPFLGIPFAIKVRCRDWDGLLATPEPQSKTAALQVFWLYSRGIALASTGKPDQAEALHERLVAIEKSTARDELFMPPVANHSWQIYHIAGDILASRIASAKKEKQKAVSLLRDAVATQDQLLYDEPQDWYYPVRESLGGLLLQQGDNQAAEQVFRDDLVRNPRNPRSLFGLWKSLALQHRDYEAQWVQEQFTSAWSGADFPLTVETL